MARGRRRRRGPARRALSSALRAPASSSSRRPSTETEAVELAGYHEPDLVVIDIGVSGLDAIAATRRITRADPGVVVILLTSAENHDLGVLGLRVGAAGYLQERSASDVDGTGDRRRAER